MAAPSALCHATALGEAASITGRRTGWRNQTYLTQAPPCLRCRPHSPEAKPFRLHGTTGDQGNRCRCCPPGKDDIEQILTRLSSAHRGRFSARLNTSSAPKTPPRSTCAILVRFWQRPSYTPCQGHLTGLPHLHHPHGMTDHPGLSAVRILVGWFSQNPSLFLAFSSW